MAAPTAAPRLLTLALLLAAGAALGVHGLNAPQVPGVALSGSQNAAGASAAAGAKQSGSASSQGASTGSGQGTTTAAASSPPAHQKGTLLSSTQVAPFTYELYPTLAAQATQAEDGFTITVTPGQGGKNSLDIKGAAGGGSLVHRSILATDKVYWIETSYGDDAPGQDANFGDDGYVLTDAQGYVTQN